MTNLEKIKNKLQKMNAKEMARAINMINDACGYCTYELTKTGVLIANLHLEMGKARKRNEM